MTLQHRLNGYKRVKYQTIKFNDQELTVYVPTRLELNALLEKCQAPDQDLIDERYEKLKESLWRTSKPTDDGIVIKDDDIEVQGNSLRQSAHWLVVMQMQEIAYIGLVGFKEGENVFALGYEEISEALSEVEIRNLVAAVKAVVSPDYKATEKN
jgi:hypothetical protein